MALYKNVAKGIKTRQENELLENNKLIAEFMSDISSMNAKVSFSKNCGVNDLQYHTSWDWLKPVVDKITELSGKLPTEEGNLPNEEDWASGFSVFMATDIQATYNAVVEFIEEYNK